jgi:ABC-type cobalamin transport system permease subunit
MALAILALAWPEDAASARLILIGIGLSSMAAVGARFIVPFSEIANVRRAMIWLAGGLRDSRWAESRRLLDRPPDGVGLSASERRGPWTPALFPKRRAQIHPYDLMCKA